MPPLFSMTLKIVGALWERGLNYNITLVSSYIILRKMFSLQYLLKKTFLSCNGPVRGIRVTLAHFQLLFRLHQTIKPPGLEIWHFKGITPCLIHFLQNVQDFVKQGHMFKKYKVQQLKSQGLCSRIGNMKYYWEDDKGTLF